MVAPTPALTVRKEGRIAWDYLTDLQKAQLLHCRPDLDEDFENSDDKGDEE